MEECLERGDEEEAKQAKESTEDRNKEDEQKVSVEEMRERAMERLDQTKKRRRETGRMSSEKSGTKAMRQ